MVSYRLACGFVPNSDSTLYIYNKLSINAKLLTNRERHMSCTGWPEVLLHIHYIQASNLYIKTKTKKMGR